MRDIKRPAEVMNLCEAVNSDMVLGSMSINLVHTYPSWIGRHGKGLGSNILFVDGHVEFFPDGEALILQWQNDTDPGQPDKYDFPFNIDMQ
jgi:prepilin-type processing-associated H-X9-DG protein